MTNDQLCRFIEYIAKDLGIEDEDVPITFVRKIRNEYNKYMPNQPIGYFRYRPDKGYDVQIYSGLSDYITLVTIAHELRHVWQHATKKHRGWNWDKKRISKETPYKQLPWEIDAEMYALKKTPVFATMIGLL